MNKTAPQSIIIEAGGGHIGVLILFFLYMYFIYIFSYILFLCVFESLP